jgi:uncharacterized protein (TIGR03435 family)
MRNDPALLFLAFSGLFAQTPAPPPSGAPPPPSWVATSPENAPKTFEVASVKIDKSLNSFSGMNYGPGHLMLTNSTLAGLVTWAYGVKDYQILAAPPWFRSDRYDVNAKAHGAPDLAHLKLLLQALLAERFNLTLHKETRQLPIFTLNVGERGIRMKRSPASTDAPQITGRFNATHKELTGHGATVTGLIQTLRLSLDRPLVDKTGLKGNYDFKLEWNPDDTDPSGISLVTAIKEQLGLKLESAKGPVEVLMIDRAERIPTAN